MEATLCLCPPSAPSKTLRCLLDTNRKIPIKQHRLILNGKGITMPALFHDTLKTRSNRMYQLLMRAKVPPPVAPEEFGNKTTGSRKARNRQMGAGAVMIISCFVGALCLNLRCARLARAAPFSWAPVGRPSSPQAAGSSPYHTPDDADSDFGGLGIVESFDILSAIFRAKARPSRLTALELVKMHMHGHKPEQRFPSITEETAIDVVYREWEKKDGPSKYYLGLLLIDIFINQGNFKKAKVICEKIDDLAPPFDDAYKFRKHIINEIQSEYGEILNQIEQKKKSQGPPQIDF